MSRNLHHFSFRNPFRSHSAMPFRLLHSPIDVGPNISISLGKVVKWIKNGATKCLRNKGLGLQVEMSQVMVWFEVGRGWSWKSKGEEDGSSSSLSLRWAVTMASRSMVVGGVKAAMDEYLLITCSKKLNHKSFIPISFNETIKTRTL
jgi:hypothetical protein